MPIQRPRPGMAGNVVIFILSIVVLLCAKVGIAKPLTLSRRPAYGSRRPAIADAPALKDLLAGALPEPKQIPGLVCIPLRRELVPIRHKGKIITYKTSYSGIIHVGNPQKDFRVVFDTGSGHIVLPSVECDREPCISKARYNLSASTTGDPMDLNGQIADPEEARDQVTIGYGTGQVRGEFVRDDVCLGPGNGASPFCVKAHTVMATELSQNPFGVFPFDGILGMGLSGLALNKNFSFMDVLSGSGQLALRHFSVFLTEGDEGQESEIAFGGHNPARLADPRSALHWAPVAMVGHGHWQVEIIALHVGDVTIDVCKEGDCRGAVDTGTSHFGIPAPYDKVVADLLTQEAGEMEDCRLAEAPEIKIELRGFNLTLSAGSYMRRLPIREDVRVGSNSAIGSSDLSNTNSTLAAGWNSTERSEEEESVVKKFCRPKLMPVRMPAPFGPNMFILGEPMLQRYYTVFDWATPQIGFGVSANKLLNRLAAEKHTRRYVTV